MIQTRSEGREVHTWQAKLSVKNGKLWDFLLISKKRIKLNLFYRVETSTSVFYYPSVNSHALKMKKIFKKSYWNVDVIKECIRNTYSNSRSSTILLLAKSSEMFSNKDSKLFYFDSISKQDVNDDNFVYFSFLFLVRCQVQNLFFWIFFETFLPLQLVLIPDRVPWEYLVRKLSLFLRLQFLLFISPFFLIFLFFVNFFLQIFCLFSKRHR